MYAFVSAGWNLGPGALRGAGNFNANTLEFAISQNVR
jgi:hypothetical protein